MNNPVVLFPGQGSQCANMGRDLAEADSSAMDLWKKAEQISGQPLREIYWGGSDDDMNDTKVLQPALLCVQLNFWRKLADKVTPAATLGHSLGEFAALAAARVLSFEDVLKVVSLRGRLMAEADPHGTGSMAAIVKLTPEKVTEIVEQVRAETNDLLVLANFNSPKQIVLSGTKKAIDLACQAAKNNKGRGMVLKVSAAFHSPMMAEANAEFVTIFKKVDWHDAICPVYGNVDGLPETSAAKILAKMEKQMVSSVFFQKAATEQYAAGFRDWLEVGPKALLIKLVFASIPSQDGCTSSEVTDYPTLQDYVQKQN